MGCVSMIIGETVKDLREQRGYTQKELAKALNITASCLSKYEKGRTQPSMEMLIQLADALNTTTDYLLGRNSFKLDYKSLKSSYYKETNGFAVMNDIMSLNTASRSNLVGHIKLLKNNMILEQIKKQK